MMNKFTYDPEADAMYITVKKGTVNKTVSLNEETIIDIDNEGNLLGIEILSVKQSKPQLLEAFGIKGDKAIGFNT